MEIVYAWGLLHPCILYINIIWRKADGRAMQGGNLCVYVYIHSIKWLREKEVPAMAMVLGADSTCDYMI